MWTGPLAHLSLSSVDVVDKDQDFLSGIGVSTALVPRMKMKTQKVKILFTILHIKEMKMFTMPINLKNG